MSNWVLLIVGIILIINAGIAYAYPAFPLGLTWTMAMTFVWTIGGIGKSIWFTGNSTNLHYGINDNYGNLWSWYHWYYSDNRWYSCSKIERKLI